MVTLDTIPKQNQKNGHAAARRPLSRLDAMILINQNMREESRRILSHVVQLSLNTSIQEEQ